MENQLRDRYGRLLLRSKADSQVIVDEIFVLRALRPVADSNLGLKSK